MSDSRLSKGDMGRVSTLPPALLPRHEFRAWSGIPDVRRSFRSKVTAARVSCPNAKFAGRASRSRVQIAKALRHRLAAQLPRCTLCVAVSRSSRRRMATYSGQTCKFSPKARA
jgi:hypothetical protein